MSLLKSILYGAALLTLGCRVWRKKNMDNRNNRDKKQINILDKFQIQTGDIKDYCIIGIDPGAGEWSASVVKLLGNTMAEVKDLYVLNDGRTCKDCSVLYYSKEADNWIIGKRAANVMVNEEIGRAHV